MSNNKLHAKIVEKASADPSFREQLLKDPNSAIAHAFPSAKLPDGVKINVVEQKPEQLYVVLPMGSAGRELSDDALEKVAGGLCICI